MCPTIVSGKSLLGTRQFVAIGQVFPMSLVTVSDVFAKDNSVRLSPSFLNWRILLTLIRTMKSKVDIE